MLRTDATKAKIAPWHTHWLRKTNAPGSPSPEVSPAPGLKAKDAKAMGVEGGAEVEEVAGEEAIAVKAVAEAKNVLLKDRGRAIALSSKKGNASSLMIASLHIFHRKV